MNLNKLKELGFNKSKHIPFTKIEQFQGKYQILVTKYHVSCSQCEALCINGMPTHETGCPNQRREKEG